MPPIGGLETPPEEKSSSQPTPPPQLPSQPQHGSKSVREILADKMSDWAERFREKAANRTANKAAKASEKVNQNQLTPEKFVANVLKYYTENISNGSIVVEECLDEFTDERISYWLSQIATVQPAVASKIDNVVIVKTTYDESGLPLLCCFTTIGQTLDVVNAIKKAFLIKGGIADAITNEFGPADILMIPIQHQS